MTNKQCFEEAQRYIPGGVNSPVRSFAAVGGAPFFVDRGKGAWLWDVEGTRYLDYVGSWGALILGHRPPAVERAAAKALRRGTTFGTPTAAETALARAVVQAFPAMEQVRFVNSGTEAVMSAVRVARGFTGRAKVLKFDGAYHGHVDYLLSQAGSGLATLGVPSSQGVPERYARDTITIPFNDVAALEHAIKAHGAELACVLVEPIPANMGLLLPEPGFLARVRALTTEQKIILIFDEVISGFRAAYGGAQTLFKIAPDLTCLGKIIGGGFPVGAYGGRKALMQLVAPAGPVYQAGTLAGHPVAMAAGLATLTTLRQGGAALYRRLAARGAALAEGLRKAAKGRGLPLTVNQHGSLVAPFFVEGPVRNAADARRADAKRYGSWFRALRRWGIYPPPSQFETWFISAAHTEHDITRTLAAAKAALEGLR
ncbi:MAG: glutamate-1-semialdehyde-2,1-aminomutase [Omnitrophica WOR_2 bacterium RIFCSPHIGHO2_02_FULL_68_15]|nr:MAG: glutamate-1-semialdehyde-2,1-aminomutase [Omnitrophica WOR_2 bacterium RIFCSPHIGHO2_02_FULL_68_15]